MNQCHDCVFYERPGHSPPECTNKERGREFPLTAHLKDLPIPLDDPQVSEACRYKLTLAEAKYQNEEGL